VGAVRERRRADIDDLLSMFLGVDREVFADVMAAKESFWAALSRSSDITHYCSKLYGRFLFVFPAPPELREFVEEHGWLGNWEVAEFSAEVPVSELVEAGAPGAEHYDEVCSACRAALYLTYTREPDIPGGAAVLVLQLYHRPEEHWYEEEEVVSALYIPAYTLDGGRLGIDASRLQEEVDEVLSAAEELGGVPGAKPPSVVDMAATAAWLASRSRGEWGEAAASTAAGLATTLVSAVAAAIHEIRRASRVRVGGLGYSTIEEKAEEVRRKALEVYSMVAEWASAGHADLPEEVEKFIMNNYSTVKESLRIAAIPNSARYAIEAAHESVEFFLNNAVAEAAATRAAAEVLASLSEPE